MEWSHIRVVEKKLAEQQDSESNETLDGNRKALEMKAVSTVS